MTENWRKIEAFPNYAVSNLGRVKRILTCKGKPLEGRVLSPYVGRGVKMVNLSDKGVSHTLRISRLVAIAFLPNPNHLQVVFHKDGDILNDRLDNLAWMSYKEAYNLGFWKSRLSDGRKRCVVARRKGSSEIAVRFKGLSDAADWLKANGRDKAAASHIVECCRGRLKSAYGYVWNYCEEET